MAINISIDYLGLTFTSTLPFEEALDELQMFSKMPKKCPYCEKDLRFFYSIREAKSGANTGKKYTYYGINCKNKDIKHEAVISKFDPSQGKQGYFFRNHWTYYNFKTKRAGELPQLFQGESWLELRGKAVDWAISTKGIRASKSNYKKLYGYMDNLLYSTGISIDDIRRLFKTYVETKFKDTEFEDNAVTIQVRADDMP